jgi:hypothetical protein
MNDSAQQPKTKDILSTVDVLKRRTNGFLIIAGFILTAVLAVKIVLADFSQMFASFQFNDLLSLLLALFSIAIAIVFYLKATETSNAFYDNSYKFTKEMSEILGRIEAGFGERLRHLDEGYAGVRERLDKMPVDTAKTEKKIEKEKELVERVERERQAIFESLAQRARLEQKEKEELFKKLKQQEEDLISARRDLTRLQRKLVTQDQISGFDVTGVPQHVLNLLNNHILDAIPPGYFQHRSSRMINSRFQRLIEGAPDDLLLMLREYGIIDYENDLTPRGIHMLRVMNSEQRSVDNG